MSMGAFSEGEHSDPACAQLEKRICPSFLSVHGEPAGQHWWSGWPGAWCIKCHDEDKDEVCLAGCGCSCHAVFYSNTDTSIKE